MIQEFDTIMPLRQNLVNVAPHENKGLFKNQMMIQRTPCVEHLKNACIMSADF